MKKWITSAKWLCVMGMLFALFFVFCPVRCNAAIKVKAGSSSASAGRVYAGNTYEVSVNEIRGAVVFVVPETGWYSFTTSNLYEKGEAKGRDYSEAYIYLQNYSDMKKTKKKKYRTFYCRKFNGVYCGKERKYIESKDFIALGSTARSKSYANKQRALYDKFYDSCDGRIELTKGKRYLITADFYFERQYVATGWKYTLKINKV